MNTHKINPSSQEHQNFLAQNRKDPITGNSISVGDEVVFCASCKSVFLRDTWEYLENRHCEQSRTLSKFPIDSSIFLKAKEVTLLYYISASKNSPVYKSKKVKKNPWIKNSNKIMPYQEFFQSWLFIVLIVLGLVSSILLTLLFQTPYIAFGGFIYVVILLFTPLIPVHYYGSKLPTFHRKLRTNSFYITDKSIGFSNMYGMKEYILPVEIIEKLEFQENIGFYNNASFKIHYKKDGVMEVANCTLPSKIYENTKFFQALDIVSSSASFVITMKIEEKKTLTCIRNVIDEENQKFVIENIQ
ncbi:hypothetical protein WAF17_02970 [Bernardetia sp. ABR2-2B]|uniref:hypothetical protein n=1 Tax=Bernardetia sp. ABR2-2B TaxID=3127472 RepID=UPI0030D4C56A